MIAEFCRWLAGMNPALDSRTGARLGLVTLEASHACFMVAVGCDSAGFDAVRVDLNTIIEALLRQNFELS
jgi:hypothetical protein